MASIDGSWLRGSGFDSYNVNTFLRRTLGYNICLKSLHKKMNKLGIGALTGSKSKVLGQKPPKGTRYDLTNCKIHEL